MIFLFIYGAIGVQLFGIVGHVQHDLNSAHVTEFAHFNDLYHAMVLLFILITGERWPEVRHGIAHCAVIQLIVLSISKAFWICRCWQSFVSRKILHIPEGCITRWFTCTSFLWSFS